MALTSTSDNPLPPLSIEEDVRTADGVRLRTVRWTPAAPPLGSIAVLGGRGEFIEKYFEVVRELLSRGFAVALMDWRGQGGSDRPLRNLWKGHVDDFSHYGLDLQAFVASVLAPYCPRPWFGLGHSMGATVLLVAAEGDRCPFERLILTSPMIAVKGVNHLGATGFLVEALDALGLGGAFVPGEGPRTLWTAPYEGNVFTSDPVRFARIANSRCGDARPSPRWPDDRLDARGVPNDEGLQRRQFSEEHNHARSHRRGRTGSGYGHSRGRTLRLTAPRGPNHRDRGRGTRNPDRARGVAAAVLGGL